MSLLDSLLWGHELEGVTHNSSPTSPSSTTRTISEPPDKHALQFWGSYGDYYGWRANIALHAICKISGPEGLIIWLDEHAPFLYRKLTITLPNKISRGWNAQISHEAFDALCFELVDTYRRGVDMYHK